MNRIYRMKRRTLILYILFILSKMKKRSAIFIGLSAKDGLALIDLRSILIVEQCDALDL
jgi:hypothetical protein